jgi:hypothetical protein
MAYNHFLAAISAIALAAPAAASVQSVNTLDNSSSASPRKICLQYETDTGSRINRVECKTREQWARQGVQVDLIKK